MIVEDHAMGVYTLQLFLNVLKGKYSIISLKILKVWAKTKVLIKYKIEEKGILQRKGLRKHPLIFKFSTTNRNILLLQDQI